MENLHLPAVWFVKNFEGGNNFFQGMFLIMCYLIRFLKCECASRSFLRIELSILNIVKHQLQVWCAAATAGAGSGLSSPHQSWYPVTSQLMWPTYRRHWRLERRQKFPEYQKWIEVVWYQSGCVVWSLVSTVCRYWCLPSSLWLQTIALVEIYLRCLWWSNICNLLFCRNFLCRHVRSAIALSSCRQFEKLCKFPKLSFVIA